MTPSSERERVLVVGGPLDGEIVTLHAECSRLGFFVHEVIDDDDPEATWWWGYFARETRDGFRIFRPGRATGPDDGPPVTCRECGAPCDTADDTGPVHPDCR